MLQAPFGSGGHAAIAVFSDAVGWNAGEWWWVDRCIRAARLDVTAAAALDRIEPPSEARRPADELDLVLAERARPWASNGDDDAVEDPDEGWLWLKMLCFWLCSSTVAKMAATAEDEMGLLFALALDAPVPDMVVACAPGVIKKPDDFSEISILNLTALTIWS